MAKVLHSIEYVTEYGEVDGYFAYLTPQEALDVMGRMRKAADLYDLGRAHVFKVDLEETPDFDSLMKAIEERYPS